MKEDYIMCNVNKYICLQKRCTRGKQNYCFVFNDVETKRISH